MKALIHSCLLAALVGTSQTASAASLYWDGVTPASWSLPGNWSTDPGAATPDPLAAPGAGDDVFFNIAVVDGPQDITLDGNQSAQSLTFFNTDTTTITANAVGNTTRVLTNGVGGVLVDAAAGAVTLGSTVNTLGVLQVVIDAPQTWTNNGTLTVNNYGNGSLVLSNTLTFDGSGVTTLTGQGASASVVTGGAGFVKKGSGTLTLGNLNSNNRIAMHNNTTGPIVMEDGTLNFSPNLYFDLGLGNSGGYGSASYTQTGGTAAYTVAGRECNIGNWTGGTNTVAFTLSGGSFSSASTVYVGKQKTAGYCTGTLTIGGGTGAATFTGPALSFGSSGITTGNTGTVLVSTNGTLVTGAISKPVAMTATFNLDGGTWQANSAYGGGTILANVLTAAQILNGGATIDSNYKNITAAQGFSDYPGHVGSLAKIGEGTLTLSGVNTYSGGTVVRAGTLALSGLGALNTAGSLTLGGGAFNLGGLSRSVGAVSITEAAPSGDTLQNGTLTASSFAASLTSGNAILSANLAGTGAGLTMNGNGAVLTLSGANSYTGTTFVQAGTLALSGSGTLGNGAPLMLGGGTLDLGGLNTAVGAVTLTQAAASGDTILNGTLTATSYAASLTSGNAIVSASLDGIGAGLTLNGAGGTLTLSGVNSYTANTVISAGTLVLSGSLSPDSSVYIAAGAAFDVSAIAPYYWGASSRLVASGTSGASASLVGNGSGIYLGSSPATLSFTPAAFTGDASHPALTVSGGSLDLGTSTIIVNNNAGSVLGVGNYTLISGSVSGAPVLDTTSGVGSGAGIAPGTGASLQVSGGQLILHISSKPATTTTLALNAPWTSSSTYGDALSFHVTVTGSGSPGGTVTVKDGGSSGTTIGVGTLSGGAADIELIALNSLSAGAHLNLVATYGGDDNNASSVSAPLAAQTVAPKTLTILGAAAQNKMVDGTVAATLTGTLSSVVSGDVVTLTNSGFFASAAVGTGIAVTANCTLGGPSAANYSLTQPTGLSANILDTGVWTSTTSGLWDGTENWLGGTVATGSGNTANFASVDLASDVTVDLASPRTIGNLVFGNSNADPAANWIVGNNGLLDNTLTLAGPAPTVNVGNLGEGKSATINAIVLGSSGLIKTGSGTLVLSGPNTFSGGTTLGANAGTLEARVNTLENGLGSGPVSLAADSVVQLNNVSTSSGASTTVNNTFTGTGRLKVQFAASSNGRNTYLPNITGFDGALELLAAGITGDKFNISSLNAPNTSVLINEGCQVFLSSSATLAGISLTGTGNSESRGAIRMGGGMTLNAPLTLIGDTSIGGENAAGTIAGTITGTATNGSVYTLTQGTPNTSAGCTFGGIISDGLDGGKVALSQTRGNLTLTAANTHSAPTTVSSSTLTFKNNLALQNSVLVLSSATLVVDPSVTNLTLGGLSSDYEVWTLPSTLPMLTLQPGADQEPVFSGTLDGADTTLVKTGPGTQVLAGYNYYSSPTVISNGVLMGVVGGSCPNSPVTVESGGALGVRVASPGSQWACGGLGGLTLNGPMPALVFDLAMNEPSTVIAPLQVNGNLALGNARLVVTNGTLTVGAAYPLIAYTGVASGTLPGGSALVLPPTVSGVISNDASSQVIYLVVGPALPPQPVMTSPVVSGGNLVFSTDDTLVGKNYILLSSPGLEPPVVWTPVSTNAGTGGPITNSVLLKPGTSREFFRYEVQ